MTARYVTDTGVFVRCGGPDNEKYRRLRSAVRRAETRLLVPRRVYEELTSSVSETYRDGLWQAGFDEGWVVVADELDYSNPTVSTVMDQTRRFVASETNRHEDVVEKADTALVGLAAQLLDEQRASQVVLLTTDKPLGKAAETLLSQHGFGRRVEYRYVGVDYLERLGPDEFRAGSY